MQGRVRVDLKLNGERMVSDEAQPGVYELRFWDGSKNVLLRTVEVISGQTSEVSIDWPAMPPR